MTSIFRRAGRSGWTVKFRDRYGRWRMRSFPTEWKAEQFRKTVALGGGEPTPTLAAWAERWLAQVAVTMRHGTAISYRWALTAHVLPTLGALPLDELSRRHIKGVLLEAAKTMKRNSLKTIRSAIVSCLAAAVEDELIPVNAAQGTTLRRDDAGPAVPKAMTLDEARAFLSAVPPEWALLFRLMILTGLRIGEALGLRWDDINWRTSRLHVLRAWSRSRIDGTKTAEPRVVDLPGVLLEALRSAHAEAQARALAGKSTAYAFPGPMGKPWKTAIVQAAFKRALGKAGLPGHFTPHSLRHTYATLQLEAGHSLKYIQQQLGHRTIALTADLYGKWADLGSAAAADDHAARLLGDKLGDRRSATARQR